MKTLPLDQQRVNREQTNVNGSEANRSHSSHVLEVKGVSSRVGKGESGSSLGNILSQAQKDQIKSKAKHVKVALHDSTQENEVDKKPVTPDKTLVLEQDFQANSDVLENETHERIESFLQNFESIHSDWEEFKLLGYNRKSPQVNQEAIIELERTAEELLQHKDRQVIYRAREVLELIKSFPQRDINALVSRKLHYDNEKERGKAVVMVAHVNASIAMLQDGLEMLAHSRQKKLSHKLAGKVKEKTRDAVIAQTLTHLSQGKENQEALKLSLQTILDEDKGALAKKLTKAQSSEFEAACITEAEKFREKAQSLKETATRVSRPMRTVTKIIGNAYKTPESNENRANAEEFLAESSSLLKGLSKDISDSAQALSPQKSTISKVSSSVGNSLIKALVAFDNPDYALESAANMVEKGGKSLAMGATALRTTAIYGTHKTTQAANTKKINHLETAEQIVDSTARAFLNQMLGAQEHITRSVEPLLSTLTTLIKEDEKLKKKLGWNYAENVALNGDTFTKSMQKALQSKEGESRERAVLNAVLDESLRMNRAQESKESRSWFKSYENLKQSVGSVNQSINRALSMMSDSNLQLVQERVLDRVPVELKPEVTKSLAALTSQMADYRTQLEKSVKALKTAVSLSGRGDFEDARKITFAAKKDADIVKQKIKTKSTELTGESLHSYSRHGRLAKSIGEWINNTKLEFSDEPKEVGEIIERVLEGFEHHGIDTLLSKRGDPLAILGSERVKTAESEAAEKMLLWGKSAAEIMKERGDLKDYFFRWGEKNVSYAAAVSLIGGAVGEGVAALEYLADFDPSLKPKMGLLKVALAPLTMEIGIRKLKNSVKPGQDLPFEEISQYVREESLKAAFRLATGLMPRGAKSALGAAITVGGLATGNSNLGKTVKSHFILDTAYVTGFMGARAVADEVIGEVLKGKTLSEDIQPTGKLSKAFDESSSTSDTYPAIARGKGEYKEAVDASLEKIASTSFGSDLLKSMNQQQIRITMPNDSVHTIEGKHAHELSAANHANPDKNTVFFDPSYKPSTEDIQSRPWLDCDPSVVLFHEMLHLYYSENPIQFEVLGQTYQFSGKGDPISEHMVAGADYVSEQGVEFYFSDSKWVKKHLKMGKYVNENDLRRALNQPIRQDYYFDAHNTGADQARFFNPSSSVEEEPTLDVEEPEFKDKIRPYNQIISEHREPNITLETGSSDESDSARRLIHSFCNEPDGFQLGLPKLLNLIDSGRVPEGVSNLVREWAAEHQAGYGIDKNILEKVLKGRGYAGFTDHAIVVSDDQGSIYISSLDKVMASTHLRSGYLSGFTEGRGAISIAELQDIYREYHSMSRLIGSTYEHFRNNTDRTSASVQLYRDPIEYISEGAVWPNLNTFSAVLEPDDERAFKSTLQKMDALEQALRLLYKEILGVEPAYKLGVESREDLAQQLDSFGEPGSEHVDEHPEYLNYRLTRRKIEALGGDIADYLASPSHLNWPMAEDGIGEDATELASSYRSMPTDAKQELYSNAVEYVLFQIGRDNLLSQGTRDAAYNARLKNEPCVVVDSAKPNSFFLPDSHGAKSGLYIDLNKPGQPYQRKANFSYQPSDLVSLNTLSRQLVTITDSHANNDEEVAELIQHVLTKGMLGAQVPDLGVHAEQVQLELEYTFATSSFSEYLRSISRPFSSLARQTQLMIDGGNGVTLQQTEKNQQQAEYIGAWIDTGVGVVTSFTPKGAVLNAVQSWAGIAADVVDGKDPDPVDLAGAILGSIPGSRAGAQIGKFSKTGGQGFKVLLKVGEETVDLIDLGRGVKQACDSGDPLDLFNVLLSTGMKAQDVIERAHQIKPDLADADIPEQNQWLIENGVDNGWGSSRPPLGVEGNPPVPGTTGRSLYGQAVPIRRPELHGGEWEGQSGTLPGTDADYFAYIKAGGTPEGYYATLKEAEPVVTPSLFSFFGKQYEGRVQDGQFEVKNVGSDEWRAGHWWEEFTWRYGNRGGQVQSSAELDKRILKAAAKDPGFNFLCNLSAINTAQASGELPKGVATSLKSTKFNSLAYKQALSLPTSVTEPSGSFLVEGPLSKGNITESGFIHTGVKDADGNVHYEHVIYAYVQDGKVTLYQSNSNTFYEAFGGDIQQPSNNRVGQSSLTKIEWSEQTDTKLAEEQRTNSNLVYSFTPTNQVKNVADISVQQNGDVEVSAGEQKEVFSVGNNAQEIARIPFINEGRKVEVRGYTSEFQGKAGEEALSIHGDRQGNFYLARQSHPMTAQQLVDYLKSQGVDLKSGSGPVHLLSCYSKSSGAAQALADVINRPVIGYSNRGIQLPTLQQLTQNPVEIGSKMGKFDPRRFLAQSDFKPATPRVYHPLSDSSQGTSFEKAGSGSGSNAKQMAFNTLPQMQASPSWYSADNIYTPKTSAHGVIFNDPDNPDRLIKFYKRPSDKGIAENNRDVMNKLYGQDAELITLTGPDGQSYYAVNMPKMKGVSIEDIKDPQVMQDMLEKIEAGDFIAHWAGKLQDNGIRVEDLNLGSVLYDPSSGRFSLVDFDSSTISDSVSNAHYKQMYRSLHTPIRDVLIKQAKTLFAGQQDKLGLVNRVEGKLSQRFRHLMELDERGEANFSTLMEEQTPADVEVAGGARNQEVASAGRADDPIQLSKGDWDSIPNKVEMFGDDSEYFYDDFDGQIYKYETDDGEITYLGKQDGEYINLKNDQTWQPRHYNVVGPNAIKTWLTGDPATLYADTDKVIADRSASYDNERLENIRNGFNQGHYLPPIDVRWDNGVFKVINGNHRLKVAREMGMESIPYRLEGQNSLSLEPQRLQSPPTPSNGRGSMLNPVRGNIGDRIEMGQICTRFHSEDDRVYYLAAKFTGPIVSRPDPEDTERWHIVKSVSRGASIRSVATASRTN